MKTESETGVKSDTPFCSRPPIKKAHSGWQYLISCLLVWLPRAGLALFCTSCSDFLALKAATFKENAQNISYTNQIFTQKIAILF